MRRYIEVSTYLHTKYKLADFKDNQEAVQNSDMIFVLNRPHTAQHCSAYIHLHRDEIAPVTSGQLKVLVGPHQSFSSDI